MHVYSTLRAYSYVSWLSAWFFILLSRDEYSCQILVRLQLGHEYSSTGNEGWVCEMPRRRRQPRNNVISTHVASSAHALPSLIGVLLRHAVPHHAFVTLSLTSSIFSGFAVHELNEGCQCMCTRRYVRRAMFQLSCLSAWYFILLSRDQYSYQILVRLQLDTSTGTAVPVMKAGFVLYYADNHET